MTPEEGNAPIVPDAAPSSARRRLRRSGLPLVENLRAVAEGIRETARDVLKAGRDEAQRAHDEAWSHYDDLTKHRRER